MHSKHSLCQVIIASAYLLSQFKCLRSQVPVSPKVFPRVTRCKNLMSREMIFQYSQQSNCDSACCLVALVRAGRVRPQVYCIHAFAQIVFAFFSISNANVSDHLQFSLYMTLNLLQNLLGSSSCFRARVRLCDNLFSPVRFFRALVALSTYMHIYSSCDRI